LIRMVDEYKKREYK